MKALRGKEIVRLDKAELVRQIQGYAVVAVDIGTGDGRFIYEMARANPDWFCIGIDSEQSNLEEYSVKIRKKTSRGGLPKPNAIYVIANAENLPTELDGVANRIYVNHPWGTLLKAVIRGERPVLDSIIRISCSPSILEMLINYSIFKDPIPIEVQGLPKLTIEYIDNELSQEYAKMGITIVEREKLTGKEQLSKMPTTWAKRLAYGREPSTVYIKAEVNSIPALLQES